MLLFSCNFLGHFIVILVKVVRPLYHQGLCA